MHRTVHRAEMPTTHDLFAWTIRTPREPGNIHRLLAVPELIAQYAQGITKLASQQRPAGRPSKETHP